MKKWRKGKVGKEKERDAANYLSKKLANSFKAASVSYREETTGQVKQRTIVKGRIGMVKKIGIERCRRLVGKFAYMHTRPWRRVHEIRPPFCITVHLLRDSP